jgi:site-specific DNA-methyltransferase (adenine-specific)
VRKEVLAEGVELYLGDCRDVFASFPPCFRVDAVVTDPPYGVELVAKQNKWVKNAGDGYASTDDTPAFVADVCVPAIRAAIGIARNVVLTPGTRNTFAYPAPDAIGTIFNPNGAGSGKWGFECNAPVLFYGKDPYLSKGLGRRPNSWEQPANDYSDKNGHPCPKPIGMMRWLVTRGSLPGETVCDPFMGSGTTGVAAVNLGRKFIGIEIEPKYFNIACKRIQAALDAPDMFVEPPKPAKQEALEL